MLFAHLAPNAVVKTTRNKFGAFCAILAGEDCKHGETRDPVAVPETPGGRQIRVAHQLNRVSGEVVITDGGVNVNSPLTALHLDPAVA